MFQRGGSLSCSLYCSMLSLPACADAGRQGSLALARFVKADKEALSHRGKPEGWILATAPLSSNPRLVLLKDDFCTSAVSQAVILCPTLGLALWQNACLGMLPGQRWQCHSNPISQSLTLYLSPAVWEPQAAASDGEISLCWRAGMLEHKPAPYRVLLSSKDPASGHFR